MTLCRDSLFLYSPNGVYSTEWSYLTNDWTVSYAIVNTRTREIVTRNFIKDGTEKRIQTPYGIAVNPNTGEFRY